MTEKFTAIFSPKQVEYNPPPGFFSGQVRDSFDSQERISTLIEALQELHLTDEIQLALPKEYNPELIYLVHKPEYVEFLKGTSKEMHEKPDVSIPRISDPTNNAVKIETYPAFTYPSVFPHGLIARSTNHEARKGIFSFDIATPISGNTYDQALLSAQIALTGADLMLDGTYPVYCLCRPPGHHAESSKMGSYCYFNNAALAAEYVRKKTNGRIAILDIDAHHGNGTQDIFYFRSDVYYGSVHGDPKSKPPYFSGYSDELGAGEGLGFNLNTPLPLNSNSEAVINAIENILHYIRQYQPNYLIVSLGFDGHKQDPSKIFAMETEAYYQVGRIINSLLLPTLIVQEGGYYIPGLGQNLNAFVKGLKGL